MLSEKEQQNEALNEREPCSASSSSSTSSTLEREEREDRQAGDNETGKKDCIFQYPFIPHEHTVGTSATNGHANCEGRHSSINSGKKATSVKLNLIINFR